MFILLEMEYKERPKMILKDGIIYSDAKTIPDREYNPAMPKGVQMPGHPDGCYKVPGRPA